MNSKFPKPGDEIKKTYIIEKKLGEGAFGVVFRAQDIKTKTDVALKMVLKKKKRTTRFAESLVGEGRILTILNGVKGTPILYEYFPWRSFNILVVELLKGDFSELLQNRANRTFSRGIILHLLHHVVTVLEQVHMHGILHRDVKPGNILLPMRQTKDVKIVLSDFGSGVKYESNFARPGMRLRLPGDDLMFELSNYHSLGMANGRMAQECDDLEMCAYMALTCLGIVFVGSADQLKAEKQDFVNDPSSLLTNGNSYLVPIVRELCTQPYGEKPDYKSILDEIKNANGVQSKRNFKLKKINGKLSLQDF